MKVAIVGSRNVEIDNLEKYIRGYDEIVSGGAKGVDLCAKEYAQRNGLKYTEFLPQYEHYGRAAPLKRNEEIVKYADMIFVFWDGKSRGSKYTIDYAKKLKKEISIIVVDIKEKLSDDI